MAQPVPADGDGKRPAVAEDFDPSAYGKHVADDYDELYADLDPTDTVDALVALADGGRVLELGIGTGRVALPLLERGVQVAGIEGSPDMARQLAAKPRGNEIPVTIGDFSSVQAGQDFAVVALVFNTIYALPSQDAQVAVFRNAALHLRSGGVFAVETWIPDLGAFRNGTAVRPVDIGEGAVVLEVAQIHPADQTMRTHKVSLGGPGGLKVWPAHHRYAWPPELDLMAQLAGMRLVHRWEDWRGTPFTDTSRAHVSVWRKT